MDAERGAGTPGPVVSVVDGHEAITPQAAACSAKYHRLKDAKRRDRCVDRVLIAARS